MSKKVTDEQRDCDHEWEVRDDSFDHEFGTEVIIYEKCVKCELTRPCQEIEL